MASTNQRNSPYMIHLLDQVEFINGYCCNTGFIYGCTGHKNLV